MAVSIALRRGGSAARALSAHAFPLTFAVLLTAVATPLFLGEVPPLTDYVNHLARMHVLAALDGDPVLAGLYEAHWAVIPNLIMDALVPPLARHMDIYLAGRLFLLLGVLLLVTGPLAVHRALWGGLSPWPLLAFPFVYNGIFLYGLINYLFGLGIALWGVAAWIALRRASPWLRAAVSAAFVLALFFCHLFAVGLYGMALLSLEAWRLWSGGRMGRAAVAVEAAVFLLPFLPVLPLMAASPTLGLSTDVLWEARGKIDGLFTIVQLYRDLPDLAFALLAGMGVTRQVRREGLELHGAGRILLLLGAAVYLAMPRVLFGSWLADQRLPVALFFLLVGFLRPAGPPRLRPAFFALVIGLTAFRLADVHLHWQELSEVTADMRQSAQLIQPGSAVLVAHADQPSGSASLNEALNHVPCVAVIESDALVSTLFTVRGKQILDVRAELRDRVDAEDGDPPTVSQMLAATKGSAANRARYWDRWPDRYRYVYVLHTRPEEENPAPDRLEKLFEGRGFQLYGVRQ